jgi:hypothetical protein
MLKFYLFLAVLILLVALSRIVVVWRRGPKAVDWELVVAFIRLDFPAEQRDIAQKIAAGLAEIVGEKIKRLRPELTLEQIVGWADNPIQASDLIKVLHAAYGIQIRRDVSRAAAEVTASRARRRSHETTAIQPKPRLREPSGRTWKRLLHEQFLDLLDDFRRLGHHLFGHLLQFFPRCQRDLNSQLLGFS